MEGVARELAEVAAGGPPRAAAAPGKPVDAQLEMERYVLSFDRFNQGWRWGHTALFWVLSFFGARRLHHWGGRQFAVSQEGR